MTTKEALKLIKTELCPIRCEGENNMDECEARCEFKEAIKVIGQEPKTDVLDKIKGYIDHIRNTGLGKKKSLEFIEKFIDGLKAESEDKE